MINDPHPHIEDPFVYEDHHAIIEEISLKRSRQVEDHKYDPAHDDGHIRGELAQAAAVYAMPPRFREDSRWPWCDGYKPAAVSDFPAGRRDELISAAALIVAEIERIDRLTRGAPGEKP